MTLPMSDERSEALRGEAAPSRENTAIDRPFERFYGGRWVRSRRGVLGWGAPSEGDEPRRKPIDTTRGRVAQGESATLTL